MPRRHRPLRQIPVHRSPVGRAVAVARMQRAMLTERIDLLLLADGEPVTETLAHLAWMIATAAETAMHALGLHHPTSRLLHGTLRSIEAMCLRNGYRWDETQALAIEAARATAHQVLIEHAATARQHMDAGHVIAHQITQQTLQAGLVAGAEIYNEPEA